MTELLKQLSSSIGAAFAAVCCFGAGWALAALSAIGAGFLINDAILVPLYAAFIAMSAWLLWPSAHGRGDLRPFYVGLAGGIAALAGVFPSSVVVFAGLATMVGASLWDFRMVRATRRACET